MSIQSKYNPDIHNRHSIRLRDYDYSQAGLYFITICCHERQCLFGEIIDGEMKLNDVGIAATQCWNEIPEHFPNATLHEYVIMPNHVHGIIELSQITSLANQTPAPGAEDIQPLHVAITGRHTNKSHNKDHNVGAEYFQPCNNTSPRNQFQKLISGSIGSIIKGYKIGVTKWARANTNNYTVWQRNYHEHIVRNEQSYRTISEYIITNPQRWEHDKFYV